MDEGEAVYCAGLLNKMAALEVALSDYYAACASRGFGRDVCTRLANDELGHANLFLAMSGRVASSKGAGFTAGQEVSADTIRAFTGYIRGQTRAVVEGDLTAPHAFAVASGMEKRFLDSRYSEIVKTDDPEFRRMMDSILKETAAHLRAMSEAR